jgi:hypothetical protein
MTEMTQEFERLDVILAGFMARFRATRDRDAQPFGGLCIDDDEADTLR